MKNGILKWTLDDYATICGIEPEDVVLMFTDDEKTEEVAALYTASNDELPYVVVEYHNGECWLYGAGREAKISKDEIWDVFFE